MIASVSPAALFTTSTWRRSLAVPATKVRAFGFQLTVASCKKEMLVYSDYLSFFIAAITASWRHFLTHFIVDHAAVLVLCLCRKASKGYQGGTKEGF